MSVGDDEDEDLFLEEVSRVIASGVDNGYNPTFALEYNIWSEEAKKKAARYTWDLVRPRYTEVWKGLFK
jgi:hypothetical protein